MANWLNPLLTTQYDVFLAEVKDRDLDSVTMFKNDPTNQPVGSVRFNRATKIFEEWSGSAWVALIIGIAGGGTGAANLGGIGGAIGLGTMAYQNSNNVNITGGIVANCQINDATYARFGIFIHPNIDNTYDCGHPSFRWKIGWFASGLVVPVGVDKFVVG